MFEQFAASVLTTVYTCAWKTIGWKSAAHHSAPAGVALGRFPEGINVMDPFDDPQVAGPIEL